MGTKNKLIYTKPRQIPLFDEEDDGDLQQHRET